MYCVKVAYAILPRWFSPSLYFPTSELCLSFKLKAIQTGGFIQKRVCLKEERGFI